MIYKVHYAGHVAFVEAKTKQSAKRWAERYFLIGVYPHPDIDWGIAEAQGTDVAVGAVIHQTKPVRWNRQCKHIVERLGYETEQRGSVTFRTKILGTVREECDHYIPDEFEFCDDCLKVMFQLNERWGSGCSYCGFDYISPDDAIRAVREAINYGMKGGQSNG